ncbi:unnamed protein product [Bursaphelenchus okinawaensis]|uniref:RNA helicase n=1 Tax=Bursaphelenchus okinawaensis TaxID=465554 RepID=A0A811LS46_9BILA|nr:unnamed protein product [Bursaphelenchus okinawaensis]CAG9127600.1 unnamed protein product [Bursaphelenchus okinawaensis]
MEESKFILPEEYEFLVDLPQIDASVIQGNEKLLQVFSRVPKKLRHFVERNLAVISLNFAKDYIEFRNPIFLGAVTKRVDVYYVNRTRPKFLVVLKLPKEQWDASYVPVAVNDFVNIERNVKLMATGRVYSVSDSEIEIRGDWRCDIKLPEENDTVDLYKHLIDFVPKAVQTAIKRIKKGELNNIILPQPELGKISSFHKGHAFTLIKYVDENPELSFLNNEQLQAVYVIDKVLHKPCPFVLFGPPGTGKTVTIVTAVRQVIKDAQHNVLICTPSNTAADRVAKELLKYVTETGPLTRRNVVRYVSPSQDFDKRDKTLDLIANVKEDGYNMKIDFTEYRIIICTLATSARLVGNYFSHLIIDEAGQANECELWIPIGCCATSASSVIFCGDPKQLGPVNMLNLPKSLSGHMECPLIRYLTLPEYSTLKQYCVQLVECFRCHKDIVSIASELFYGGNLENSGDQKWKETLCVDDNWIRRGRSILFVNVDDEQHIQDPNGSSFGNKAEAMVVFKFIKLVHAKLGVDFKNIGVVSPYKYHSKLIRELVIKKFGKQVLNDLTVDSVERFQGNEREVIIMSTARTEGNGFLFCNLRLNTAITRAQRLLIVVGNRSLLEKHRNWKRFIDFVEEKKGYCNSCPIKRIVRKGEDKFESCAISIEETTKDEPAKKELPNPEEEPKKNDKMLKSENGFMCVDKLFTNFGGWPKTKPRKFIDDFGPKLTPLQRILKNEGYTMEYMSSGTKVTLTERPKYRKR